MFKRPREEGGGDGGRFSSSRGGSRGGSSFGGGRGFGGGDRGGRGGRGFGGGDRGFGGRGGGRGFGGDGGFRGRGFSGGEGGFRGGRGGDFGGRSFHGGRGGGFSSRGGFNRHQQDEFNHNVAPTESGIEQEAAAAAAVRRAPTRMASSSSSSNNNNKKEPNIVVILEKAGLFLGRDGLVDAYDRAASTELANDSLEGVRPDIVHQCLLALFDTDLAYRRRVRVYISTIKGKTIEVSPILRPPRTYGRFKGLMSALLRDGHVSSVEGQTLMKILPGSVAPIVPHGAAVFGLCNSTSAPVVRPSELATKALAEPISNELQGGLKNVAAFYCISCTDDQNLSGIDYVTKPVCLSVYPTTSHVMCARICEGYGRCIGPVVRDAGVGATEETPE